MMMEYDPYNMPVSSRPALKWGHLQGTDWLQPARWPAIDMSYLELDTVLINKIDIDIKSSSWGKGNSFLIDSYLYVDKYK